MSMQVQKSPKQKLNPGVRNNSNATTPQDVGKQGPIPSSVATLILESSYGSATKELTDLVMAAEQAFDNFGKRSLFGKDKGKEAQGKFESAVVDAVLALERVGIIKNAKDAEQSFAALSTAMSLVRKAFPNWPRAYRYWDTFCSDAYNNK